MVANTPKTLKEIMPVLMRTLIDSLASTSNERRQVVNRETRLRRTYLYVFVVL